MRIIISCQAVELNIGLLPYYLDFVRPKQHEQNNNKNGNFNNQS